ncbi:type II secretion system protein [Paraburkholderia sp. J94]|uniref:type II secretion system protein n=1 Tax=Paraburkholderia sp. J94 TaxID=2805441 RepID=UPI002AB27EE7|nr:type II secretion system protein [Paraburkholderia sp. J94]
MVSTYSNRKRQQGVAHLWALMLVLVISLGVGKLVQRMSIVNQRMREAELLYVGGLYGEAIRQYHESTPVGSNPYPERLQDLLRDPRYPVTRRYLRQLYRDPVTGEPFETITAAEGGIRAVRSTSPRTPVKIAGFNADEQQFMNAKTYREWEFGIAP